MLTGKSILWWLFVAAFLVCLATSSTAHGAGSATDALPQPKYSDSERRRGDTFADVPEACDAAASRDPPAALLQRASGIALMATAAPPSEDEVAEEEEDEELEGAPPAQANASLTAEAEVPAASPDPSLRDDRARAADADGATPGVEPKNSSRQMDIGEGLDMVRAASSVTGPVWSGVRGRGESGGEEGAGEHEAEHGSEPPHGADGGKLHRPHFVGGHHGHAKDYDSTAVALSLTLLGMVAVVMSLFYLVNWPDEDIQRATWNILSSSLSIFGAVLIFSALKGITMIIFKEEQPDHGHGGTTEVTDLVMPLARVLLVVAAFHGSLFLVKGSQTLLQAVGAMGAHVVGFALIDFFGTTQQLKSFNSSPFMSLVEASLSALTIGGFVIAATMARDRLGAPLRNSRWARQCCESENDFSGLSLGLLLCQVVKFSISGHLPPVHGAPKGKTGTEVWSLFGVSMLFVGMVIMSSTWVKKLQSEGVRGTRRRAANISLTIASMTLGWSLLYWGQWLFWNWTSGQGVGEGDAMSARMLMVIGFGITGFGTIFLLDFIADKGWVDRSCVEGLIDTVGLLLGLSWEACITTAVVGLGQALPRREHVVDSSVDIFLCVAVIPAWALFILPQALKYAENESDDESVDGKGKDSASPKGAEEAFLERKGF
jgi:hypothetical protein